MRSWNQFCRVVESIPSCGVVAPGCAVNLPQFLLQRDHDHATIGPRSCVDCDPGHQSIAVRSSGRIVASILR